MCQQAAAKQTIIELLYTGIAVSSILFFNEYIFSIKEILKSFELKLNLISAKQFTTNSLSLKITWSFQIEIVLKSGIAGTIRQYRIERVCSIFFLLPFTTDIFI